MTINKNSVEQINVALLDMDKKIKSAISNGTSASDFKNLEALVDSIKKNLNETNAGLESGKTYNINISGNAATATKATTATTAETATNAETAITANHALAADSAGTADKAVEVVDYGDTSKTVRIGYIGPGVTADKLLHLAGYTEISDSSVKLKDVSKEEIIKWLGIPRVKYADYKTGDITFNSTTDQKGIELSNFGPDVTEDNVLSFMVIWWSGIIITASGDWAKSQGTSSSGLKCALHALQAGTGQCVIRCVYMV